MRHHNNFIREFFEKAKEECLSQIGHAAHGQVMAIDARQWAEELLTRYELPTIEEAGEPSYDTSTDRSQTSDYGRNIVVEYEDLVVQFPVVEKPNLDVSLSLKTSVFDQSVPEFTYSGGVITFRVRVGNVSEIHQPFIQENATKRLEGNLRGLRNDIKQRNHEIQQGHQNLHRVAEEAILRRKEQIGQKEAAMKQLADKIQIPLRKRTEVPPQIIELKPKASGATTKPQSVQKHLEKEYTLDRNRFLTLLGFMKRYIRDCERTPDTFAKLKEEEIRNLLLPYLNQVFEGGASGETFSKHGKTDIYLVVEKGCILICECKWWRGPQSIGEVTEQILKRVTWRENFGIALLFIDRNFSQVLESAAGVIANMPSNVTKTVDKTDQAHYMSRNRLPEDKSKSVELHFIFCNFCGRPSN